MTPQASTFELLTNRPDRVVEALCRQFDLRRTRSAIVFVSGALAPLLPELAQAMAVEARHVQLLLLPALGVLTERGERERDSAAVALLLPQRVAVWTTKRADTNFGSRVCACLDLERGSSAFVAVRTDEGDDGWLEHLGRHFKDRAAPVFGGGLLPRLEPCSIVDGMVQFGAAAAAIFPPQLLARFRTSGACRLISPLRHVTKARGPVLHEMEGMLALDRLNEATQDVEGQPVVLIAIAAGDSPLSPRGRSLALRTIQGVDPGRGALILGESIPEGARVAFAVRDARASRDDLKLQLDTLRQEVAGSALLFGVFVNCAGRGRGLYGSDDVDLRIIKSAFPHLPLVGMQSSFELAPLAGRTVPQIYNAVIGVFCAPS